MLTALVQMNSGSDKEKNIAKALLFAKRAIKKGAGFILFPEVFNYRGPASPKEKFSFIAENIPGPSSLPFMQLARKHSVFIQLGSLYERIPASSKVYNTSVLIDSSGKVSAKYRKMNLFTAALGQTLIRETESFVAGKVPAVGQVDDFKVGLSVCYDLRFPELYRGYFKKGAHILCIPSAFTRTTGRAHFETLLRARAIENLSYVLAPDQTGIDGRGIPAYGNSMIISPWGEVLARASANKEEVIMAPITRAYLQGKRAVLPGIV